MHAFPTAVPRRPPPAACRRVWHPALCGCYAYRVPRREKQQLTAEQAIASGAWAQPVWLRYKRAVERERSLCWLLVALAAISLWPLGSMLEYGIMLAWMGVSSISQGRTDAFTDAPFAAMSALGMVLCVLFSWVLPAVAVFLAVSAYRRQYQLAVRDLVYGNVALMLIDESYGQVVEQAAQERYRPNPNRVDFGHDFNGRVNHFAHYYAAYYRLSWGPAEVTVPLTVERNCWAEGALLGLGLCTTSCCIGVLLTLPLSFRAVLVWPRLLAIKQAVLEFFGGRFDSAWEQPAAPGPAVPGSHAAGRGVR